MSSNFGLAPGKISSPRAGRNRNEPGSGSKKALWACILCVLMEKMRKRPSAEAGFIERCLLSTAFSVST
jgi:hypothetical protein